MGHELRMAHYSKDEVKDGPTSDGGKALQALVTRVAQDRDAGARHLTGKALLEHPIMRSVDCGKCGFDDESGDDEDDDDADFVKHTGVFFPETTR